MDTDTSKPELSQPDEIDPATNASIRDDSINRMDDGEGGDASDEADDQPQIQCRDPNLRPVFKLSVKLLETYKHINKVRFRCFVYFLSKSQPY